jgi:hypothetical protein
MSVRHNGKMAESIQAKKEASKWVPPDGLSTDELVEAVISRHRFHAQMVDGLRRRVWRPMKQSDVSKLPEKDRYVRRYIIKAKWWPELKVMLFASLEREGQPKQPTPEEKAEQHKARQRVWWHENKVEINKRREQRNAERLAQRNGNQPGEETVQSPVENIQRCRLDTCPNCHARFYICVDRDTMS